MRIRLPTNLTSEATRGRIKTEGKTYRQPSPDGKKLGEISQVKSFGLTDGDECKSSKDYILWCLKNNQHPLKITLGTVPRYGRDFNCRGGGSCAPAGSEPQGF